MNRLCFLLTLSLVSCTGAGSLIPGSPLGNALASGTTDGQQLSQAAGQQLGAREAQELDSYLASAMRMKREIEVTGRSIKQSHSSDPVVQRMAQYKYSLATAELEHLRQSVRGDFSSKAAGPSANTLQAADSFQQRGNEFLAYQGEINGGERFGGTVIVALQLLGEIYRAWSGFEMQRQQAVLNGVDQRLSSVPWGSL